MDRAEGLAGRPRSIRSQHGLVAFLWCSDGFSEFELESWGTSGSVVVEAAHNAGLLLPTVPRTQPDRTPWGEPVFVLVDRFSDVVRALRERLDAGTWGCKSHDDRAFVHTHAHIDPQAIVDGVLAS